MSSDTILRWTPAGWATDPADPAGGGAEVARPVGHRVLAADSFLVDEGRVLALDVHWQRFLASLRLQGAAVPDPAAFLDAAVAALPRAGAWFPRVEALRGPDGDVARLLLRPAPERTATVVLRDHDGPDPRTMPRVKGPDLHALGALRSRAARHGAGEAVILAADGTIVEGAYSAIVWWHGDALAVVEGDVPRIPSVTERSVVALATALGIDVLHDRVRPADLNGHEVWAVSALHGIRLVREWIGGPSVAAEPGRVRAWRSRLDALRRELPAG
ncbi:aminotransferase class IV [Clavibacter zhangzhiyongii]|uniref:Aminotransferase class IV n=1 Tax=Clavibacter zhangzhiyongii TaxID=2768071 RepID=A0A7L7YYD6_9MICO|nr:aminotransferase class IV [Clavibacter zhangzhiyongii]QOD42482.1 aminotransferase class IV [Clavibacter zhangzhiyongii]